MDRERGKGGKKRISFRKLTFWIFHLGPSQGTPDVHTAPEKASLLLIRRPHDPSESNSRGSDRSVAQVICPDCCGSSILDALRHSLFQFLACYVCLAGGTALGVGGRRLESGGPCRGGK